MRDGGVWGGWAYDATVTTVDERAPVRRVPVLVLVGLLSVLVVGVGGWWIHDRSRERAPFEAGELSATAVVKFTEWPRFAADARSIGAEEQGARPAGAPEDRLFVGRVEHRTPAVEDGEPLSYHVLVIDKHHERAAGLGNLVGSRPAYLTSLPERYPWLSALARVGDEPQGWFVEAPVTESGEITFAGSVPDGSSMTEKDLMVVLVLVARDGTAHWAERVTA